MARAPSQGIRRSLTVALAAAASTPVLAPAAAPADGTKRTAAGSDPASIAAGIKPTLPTSLRGGSTLRTHVAI